MKKTTVTNLHHFFPTDKETKIDDKESTNDASKTTESRLTSSKTSLQSTEPSAPDTTRTSGMMSVFNVCSMSFLTALSDDLSKESVKDSCKEEENEDVPRVKKRQRRQSPMSTEIITGLDSKENIPSVKSGDKDSSKILENNKDSTETTISKDSESDEEKDEVKQKETQPETQSKTKAKSSVILEAGKQGNKRFHSISHITYFARAAKAALGKVHKSIVNKEEDVEEVQEEEEETKDHVEDFSKFAFKHLKKKRAFHQM